MANADTAFTLRRTFDAPRELVFKMLTEAEHLAHWWGPKGCTIAIKRHEARPGGIFHYRMDFGGAPVDGMWGRFDYEEIEPPIRVVFINGFADEEGARTRGTMLPVWPLEVRNTVTLEEQGGRTELTLHAEPINASAAEMAAFLAMHASLAQGYGGSFDVLAAYLARLPLNG